ncbi:GNAT family N-acetyltransferase [Calditerricola satsumensis]|uniref:N-acetyltransferase domain-containing protein n=1 Tax=Calditerricola satsumensis TaxID=373054 RepID=A0A8J3B8E3_9BACI|nr:GNAT family N-acetyltransferase [Calditerricola satsumensis]GGJ92834.1 hypothetical protein GCM10007043_03150 [Calditerricola satsumensis]
MKIRVVPPAEWERLRPRVLALVRRHGDRRITHRAIRWLRHLGPDDLNQPGTLVVVAQTAKGGLAGCLAACDYGRKESLVVVHPAFRRRGIAKALTAAVIHRLGKLYVRVAVDNVPSLKTCFSLGMVAFRLFTGPTGKPTLWLGCGDWRPEDVGTSRNP